ncbi:hypothetical protein BLAT2472_60053 [Burkholderia latens]
MQRRSIEPAGDPLPWLKHLLYPLHSNNPSALCVTALTSRFVAQRRSFVRSMTKGFYGRRLPR